MVRPFLAQLGACNLWPSGSVGIRVTWGENNPQQTDEVQEFY